MKTIVRFYLLFLIFSGCSSQDKPADLVVHEINGRQSTPLYRVKAPHDWEFKKPEISDDLNDTTKSIAEFFIHEESNEIRITIHNFPSKTVEERIPPSAQIIRWKRQFDVINPLTVSITPQAFAGFVGAFFEASGKIADSETALLAWSMQLAPEHYRRLPENEEKRCCYTIKAIGPTEFIEKNRKAIISFSRSFELIHEI